MAFQPDEALRLLAEPTADERRILGAFTYSRNETLLPTDASLLPSDRRARASWNYLMPSCTASPELVRVSYDMNRLGGTSDAAGGRDVNSLAVTGGYPWAAFSVGLGWSALAAVAVMAAAFVVAAATDYRLADVARGLAFAAVAAASCAASAGYGDPARRALLTAATALCGLRLAVHIDQRLRPGPALSVRPAVVPPHRLTARPARTDDVARAGIGSAAASASRTTRRPPRGGRGPPVFWGE